MRILHVIPSFYPAFVYGGPIFSVYDLCASLAELGCEVRVLTTDANGRERVLDVPRGQDVPIKDGFAVRYCRRRASHSASPELLRQLPRYVRWADVIHLGAVYSFPTFPTLAVARIFHKPVVWSPHGGLQHWSGASRPLLKGMWVGIATFLAPNDAVVHATSERERTESQQHFPHLRCAVIRNGVQLPNCWSHRDGDGVLKLLFLGRLHPIKGIENLLRACASLKGGLSRNWSLVIAGGGETNYVEQLRLLTVSLGLNSQVRFAGEVLGAEKEELFCSSDIAVVPSYSENFGMVVAEALAHGVPVIASKATPWSEVERIGCGLWVESDAASLATAIRALCDRPLREMGRRGREWMQAQFSWQGVAQEILDLYREIRAA